MVDLTQPGWLASKENTESLEKKLKEIECNEQSTLVFDLFGNSSFRFEQFDGSLSMPFKQAGKYHMGGNIAVCPPPVYKRILETTASLLTTHHSSKVILVPPLPRYLFTGCCNQPGHSTNISAPGYSTTLLSDTIGLRNLLKKFVVGLGIKRWLVMDSCCVADCPATANTATRLGALKKVCAQDGVHFAPDGYHNLVELIVKCDSLLSVKSVIAAPTAAKQCHYWRGFKSCRGSALGNTSLRDATRGGKFGRGGRFARTFHPYRRGK